MDINLSGLRMLFVDTIGSRSAQPQLKTTIKTSPSHKATVDNLRRTDSCRTHKTDNSGGNTQDGLADSSPLDLSRELRQKTTRRAPSYNIPEIKCPKTRRQNGGTIEATVQLPLPADIPGLNLARSSGAQESTKAAATAGTSQPYVCRPGLKQILSDVSNSAGAGLKQQARVANAGPGAKHAVKAETGKINDALSATSSDAKVRLWTTASASAPDISSTTPANGKKPLMEKFLEPASSNDLDGRRRELKSPRKSELATEKTTGHKVIDNCKLVLSSVEGSKIESFVCSAQAKTASNPDSKGKPGVNIERLYSFHDSQTVLSDPSSTVSQATRIANDAPYSNVAGSVSQQMATSIEGSLRQADTHLTIHLNPPELGRVFVRFQQEQDQITILLEVSKPQTRREIDLALPQIMRSLQDAGVQVRRLEVSAPAGSDELQQQPDTGAPGQNNGEMSPHHFAGQDDSDPDQIGAAHGNTGDEESFPESLTSTFKDHYQDESAQLLVFTGGSINMLI